MPDTWEHVTDYWSSVGLTDEVVHVYAATGLRDAHADSGENERIEIVRVAAGRPRRGHRRDA